MAYPRYQLFAQDQYGNVQSSALITVRLESNNGLATLYGDPDGLVPKTNPFNADGDGYGFFHVGAGTYRIKVEKNGSSREYRYVDIGVGGSPTTDLVSLNDVAISSPVLGDGLYWDGTNWVNRKAGHDIATASQALRFIKGEEGLAIHFPSKGACIVDRAGLLTWHGDPKDLLAFTRSSDGTYLDKDTKMKSAASGVLRYNYNSVNGRSLGLLIEDASTNLLLQSRSFSSPWGLTRATASTVAGASLFNDVATKLIANTDNNTHSISQSFSAAASTTYTYSVFLKAAEHTAASVTINNFANQVASNTINIDLLTGTFVATDVNRTKVEQYPDGWWRVSSTVTTIASAVTIVPAVFSKANHAGSTTFIGDGSSGILVADAQLEVQFESTTPILTGAATTARAAENIFINTSAFPFDKDNCTIIAIFTPDHNPTAAGLFRYALSLSENTTTANLFSLRLNVTPTLNANTGSASVFDGSVSAGGALPKRTRIKSAATIRKESLNIHVNGATASDTTLTLPVTLQRLYIGSQTGNQRFLNGNLEAIAVINRALSLDEIAEFLS